MKTVERAHTPKEMWEKVKLDKSYNLALEQIDENLQFWPEFYIHKCKQRFTKIRQTLVRRRKMRLKDTENYEIVSRKATKREKSREKKAEKAALIERHIEEELLKKLQLPEYDEIYNTQQKNFQNAVSKIQIQEQEELEEEDEEEEEELEQLVEENYEYSDEESLVSEKLVETNINKNNKKKDSNNKKDFFVEDFSDDDSLEDIHYKNVTKKESKINSLKANKSKPKIQYEEENFNTNKSTSLKPKPKINKAQKALKSLKKGY